MPGLAGIAKKSWLGLVSFEMLVVETLSSENNWLDVISPRIAGSGPYR